MFSSQYGVFLVAIHLTALIFLLILLHMAGRWFSKFSSGSMVIPNRVSAVLDVICIQSMDTTSELLVLSNRWHLPGLAFIWLLPNQLKTFVEISCNSEMTVGMSVPQEYGVVSSA